MKIKLALLILSLVLLTSCNNSQNVKTNEEPTTVDKEKTSTENKITPKKYTSYADYKMQKEGKSLEDLFKEEDYSTIGQILVSGRDDDIKTKTLYYYAMALRAKQEKQFGIIEHHLREIPTDVHGNLIYSGSLEEEISQMMRQYDLMKFKEPAIGMTEEEVLNSSWGKPKDINRTITQYGTSEQWVYSIDRYIYFDDGIVTAIQD